MQNPLGKLKKFRGRTFEEIRVRGEQTLTAYGEKLGLTGQLPNDADFLRLIDEEPFGGAEPSAEDLLENFGTWNNAQFFPSFFDKDLTVQAYKLYFGERPAQQIIKRAESIVAGKIPLLGYEGLDFGVPIDWHLEPIAGKHSPLKHWKEFDEVDTSETGDKKIIWELNRHQHFFTLGAAYWLSGDEKFATTFIMHLCSWMEQNPPSLGVNWVSSLEVSFRAISWLWALHFFRLSPNLTPNVFRDALKHLYAHGRHIEKYLSTYYSPNTHLTGEALGLYYLGTLLPEFKRSSQWRELGSRILIDELDRQILNDGVYFERTTWYQRYTVDFYTHFLILSRLNENVTQSDNGKLAEKLQLALDFQMHTTRPDGTTPFIGDDDGGRMLPHSLRAVNDFRSGLATGAALFGRGDYKFVAQEPAEETLWLLGAEGMRKFAKQNMREPRETSKAFPDGGFYVMRESWTDSANFMLLDGGEHGVGNCGHSHADALSFELAACGNTLLVDPGTYTYHESIEKRDFFRSTRAHNTLTIDGKPSSEPFESFKWRNIANIQTNEWKSNSRFDFWEGQHDGFSRLSPDEIIHARDVLFIKRDYWIMRDLVQTTDAHNYELNFHFDAGAKPELTTSENSIPIVRQIADGDAGLETFVFGDGGVWQTYEDWIAPVFGVKIPAPTAVFASSGTGTQEFFTFLLPSQKDAPIPQAFEIAAQAGRAFSIKFNNYHDIFAYGDGDEHELVRTKRFDSNFRFAWARFGADAQSIEEIILIDGNKLIFDGKEIINHPTKLNYAIITRNNNKFHVTTEDTTFSVNLPHRTRNNS